MPHTGLSGQLWIGSGFADDTLQQGAGEGELGCSDIPGWHDTRERTSRIGDTSGDPTAPVEIQRRLDGQSAHVEGSIYGGHQLGKISEIPGKIVLLSRGGCGFLEKVMWAQRRGATALVVGDNQKGGPLIQMFAKGDTSNVTIPSVFTARTAAHLLSSLTQPGSFIMETFDEKGRRAFTVQQSDWSGAEDEPVDISSVIDQSARKQEDATHRGLSDASSTQQPTWWQKLFGRGMVALDLPDDATRNPANRPSNVKRHVDSSTNYYKPTGDAPRSHDGLWVTITPSNNASPFFDTLLVLVISPLITLTVVYAMLIVRARIRRRRWRAPKSVVEQLPVRTYHTVVASPLHTPRAPSPASPSATTPLLQQPYSHEAPPVQAMPRAIVGAGTADADNLLTSSSPGPSLGLPPRPEHEKIPGSVSSEWKKYMGRQIECVVCLEEYVDGVSQVMSLPCGHEFHAECITPWLTTRRRTCPICKGDVVRSLARGPTSSPRYEPYRDDSDEDDDTQASGSGSRGEDVERGILSPTPTHRPNRAEAWLGRLSHSFGATSRSSEPVPENHGR